MKKMILVTAIVIIAAIAFVTMRSIASASELADEQTQQDKCKQGCAEKRDACLSNVGSKDDEHTRDRRNACYKAWQDCYEACGKIK